MEELKKDDLKRLTTHSLRDRKSLIKRQDFGMPLNSDSTVGNFLEKLPKSYMAKDLIRVAKQMSICRNEKRTIHYSVGSHVIKNGLSPYLLDLMERKYVTALSFNGSAIIHDFEIAFIGSTSEDVDEGIGEGKFGLARETAQSLSEATGIGVTNGLGLGKSIGKWILENTAHPEDSLLAQAVVKGIPATVHVAIGTDIIHIHPEFDAEKTALGSYRDFLTFASSVRQLEGGIILNIGSAVILPEIFLKALSMVRNLGGRVDSFWAVNFDFIRQYRPNRNVLERPTKGGGVAVEIVGPHELLIPLLHAAILHYEQKN